MNFKPMLAEPVEDTAKIRYPVLVSVKYDGIRAMMQNGKLVSRKLKDIPNIYVQKMFARLPEGLDGELLAGNPTDKNAMQHTSTAVMSRSKPITDVKFYVFDHFHQTAPFVDRFRHASYLVADLPDVVFVTGTLVHNEKELLEFEEQALNAGYEGIMVRDPKGPYKQGRSTWKQGWLLKLKRFVDAEAKIVGFYEEMENTNEAKKDLLGRTERSSHKAGMVGKGSLGGFEVIGLNGIFKDVDFRVGSGMTAEQKADYWKIRTKLSGKILKYKYFPIGVKDKPRLPIFLGFRDKADM